MRRNLAWVGLQQQEAWPNMAAPTSPWGLASQMKGKGAGHPRMWSSKRPPQCVSHREGPRWSLGSWLPTQSSKSAHRGFVKPAKASRGAPAPPSCWPWGCFLTVTCPVV